MATAANTKGSNNIGAVARIAWQITAVHGTGTGWGKNQHGQGNGGSTYTIALLPGGKRQFAASAKPAKGKGKALVSAGTFAQAYHACASHNKAQHAAKLARSAKRGAAAPAQPVASASA